MSLKIQVNWKSYYVLRLPYFAISSSPALSVRCVGVLLALLVPLTGTPPSLTPLASSPTLAGLVPLSP
jgi:hypothetical protein